jgi:hypothetical protein
MLCRDGVDTSFWVWLGAQLAILDCGLFLCFRLQMVLSCSGCNSLLLLQVLDDKVLLSSSSAVALAAISAAGGQRP